MESHPTGQSADTGGRPPAEHPHIRRRRPDDAPERSGLAVVVVPEFLTVSTRLSFRAAVEGILDSGIAELVLSFEGTSLVDSAGLGYLVGLRRETLEAGVNLTCCRCSPAVRAQFELSRLTGRFNVRPDDRLEPW